MSLRMEIEAQYSRELDGYVRLGELAWTLSQRNQSLVAIDTARPSTAAVLGLHAKARKSFQAIDVLAREGYGEDAMIVARSLVNLCIDLGYICRTDSENRARQWMARGRVSRRDMAKTFHRTPSDESTVDWTVMITRAKEWKDVSILNRAKDAGLLNFYEIAYRHGSVYEHSDAWGALAFLDLVADAVEVQPDPSPHLVDNALLIGAFAFAQVVQTVAEFWKFDFGGLDTEIHTVVSTAFERSASSHSEDSSSA